MQILTADIMTEFEYLEKYFNVISSVKDITEHICNVIMEVEL